MFAEEMSILIGTIYDAALDASLWPGVLWATATFVGAQAAGLLSKGSVKLTGTIHYHVGVEQKFLEAYEAGVWRYDPMGPLALFDVGEVTSRLDYIDNDEYLEGRFHREWAKPQGWIDSATTVLEKSPEFFSVLSYLRSETVGVVDDEMRERVRLLIPHIRRSVLIGNAIDLKAAEVSSFAAALDAVAAGVFLLDGAQRLVHANRAGEALLSGGLFHNTTGRLIASDPDVDQALRAAVTSLAGGGDTLGGSALALPIVGAGGDRYRVHLLPLLAGARQEIARRHAATSAVFVTKTGIQAPSAPEQIADAFALTPAEMRVLLAMLDVDGVAEIARLLGVSETTVSTHIGRLYAKTGLRRQTELVKLLADFADPVVR